MTSPLRSRFFALFALVTAVAAGCANGSPAVPEGLVAHYELNGDGGDSVGSSNGVVAGAEPVEDRFGATGAALHFAGEGDYIEIEHSDALDLSSDFTIAA